MTNKKLKDVITHIVPFTESNIAHHLEPVIKELVEVHFSDCLIYAVIDYVVRLDFETQGLSLRDWREDSFDWSRNMTNTPVAKHLVATLARDHAPHFVEYCDEFYPFLGLASPEASIYQTLRNMQGFGLTSGLYLESTEYGRDSITVFFKQAP